MSLHGHTNVAGATFMIATIQSGISRIDAGVMAFPQNLGLAFAKILAFSRRFTT
jgi:hypothetical protein